MAKLLAVKPPPTPTGTASVVLDASVENLQKIEHIVVLMLENRSFDHMLGYLTLNGRRDIDGLTGQEFNVAPDGSTHPVHPLGARTAFTGEAEDPDHSGTSVDEQVRDDCGGFVANFARHSAQQAEKLKVPVPDPGLVMGYYTERELPVYDYLARQFCVCDRWFSSVPGATWPNRLYAVAGRAEDSRDDRSPPLYELPAFVRFLDQRNIDWRWYSYDPATLRSVDPLYRFSSHNHFAFLDSSKISTEERLIGNLTETGRSFIEDAAAGSLPPVAWIDPHFKDLRVLGPDSNDDHPPSDVTAGQHLVLSVYHALRTGPAWEKTMLVIAYDEHGGFYDHVSPPQAPGVAPFDRYGVRVPALAISPYIEAAHVPRAADGEKAIFDHTSIIKTILLRFCLEHDRIPDLGVRVNSAEHLGGLLTRAAARADSEIEGHVPLIAPLEAWAEEMRSKRFAANPAPPSAPRPLTDFQSGFYESARLLRRAGLPAGHP
ncbi:MAG TPA: alkaline phosphatase family protein [Solirubrobacteraceae bacterium]